MTEINERIAKVREQIIDTKIIREKLGLKDYDEIIDDFEVFITTIESQKEEIERMKLQIRRAHLSLSWSNIENQIPHAIYHLEQAVPVEQDSPEYIEAARIFMQEGEK